MSYYIQNPADIPDDHPDATAAFFDLMDQQDAQKQARAERMSKLLHGCDAAYFESWKKQQEPQVQKTFVEYWETAENSIAPFTADESSPAYVNHETESQLKWAMETEKLEHATLDWEEVTRIMERILALVDEAALRGAQYSLREISVVKRKMRGERRKKQMQTMRTRHAKLKCK
jgi:nucleoid DNA-binding protein